MGKASIYHILLVAWLVPGLLLHARSARAQDTLDVTQVMDILAAGNAEGLMALAGEHVELALLGQTRRYSQHQALYVLKEFFKRYPPEEFVLGHSLKQGAEWWLTVQYQVRYDQAQMRVYLRLAGAIPGLYVTGYSDYSLVMSRRGFSILLIIGLLTAALLVTLGARSWQLAKANRQAAVYQVSAVTEAEEHVHQAFAQLQRVMLTRAREIATDSTVIRALTNSGGGTAPTLIRDFTARQLPRRWSLSCYDTAMRLIAWQGESLPLQAGISANTDRVQWAIARDDDWREAIALWHPVRHEDNVVGAIRLTQLVSSRVPVRNEALQDFAVSDAWSLSTGLRIQAHYDSLRESASVLTSLEGDSLGSFVIVAPTVAGLLQGIAWQYDSILAFWATLLIGWLVWGLWRWHRRAESMLRLVTLSAAIVFSRYGLLWMDVPGRFQTIDSSLSPLFDPTHLASTLGMGLMKSAGEMLLTAICGVLIAAVIMEYAVRQCGSNGRQATDPVRWNLRLIVAVLINVTLTCGLALIIRASVHDSTLDYIGRTTLVPSPLELVVFTALFLAILALILASTGLLRIALGDRESRPGVWMAWPAAALAVLAVIAVDLLGWSPWLISLLYLVVCAHLATRNMLRDRHEWLTVRTVFPATLVITLLLYPLFSISLSQRHRERVEYAATSFAAGHNPGVSFAVREVTQEALRLEWAEDALEDIGELESVSSALLNGSLLSFFGSYDVSIAYLDLEGEVVHTVGVPAQAVVPEVFRDRIAQILGQGEPSQGIYVPYTRSTNNRSQYAGLGVLGSSRDDAGFQPIGWILVQAQPHVVLEEANTPLLRMLLASGYRDLYANLSLASYSDELLVFSTGRSFDRYQRDPTASARLAETPSVWLREDIKGRAYRTHYKRQDGQVIAVRAATIGFSDHLFYILRLIVGGFIVGIFACIIGIILRWRAGQIPAEKIRFRDKAFNAFWLLGIVAVIPVGIAGVQVVTEENEKAVQSWLRQHLERVEESLSAEAQPGELSASVLERITIDSLAAHVGLDLNLYRGTELIAASRDQLIADHIIDSRLPATAYEAIMLDKDRFTFVEHRLGDFVYTAGYRAILDEAGHPAYVLSVPTLPEAERIEEERARTLALLFGSLLALGVLVMFTASILANLLARPIAQLRRGLQAVAKGRFERMPALRTRDELGELVQTFNDMQGQLFESRRQLARQQRQLAWGEMARQVAHEIKNPLTPMKLSLQHLQHAFARDKGQDDRFRPLFARITKTLLDQIDSLAYIANEFASFARLPERDVARLDLALVIREAHALLREEAPEHVTFRLELADGELFVMADLSELRRIYINLIKNAIEALRDKADGTISITVTQTDDGIESVVRDTGCGIPAELHDQIFEPSFSTKTRGSGLGLAITRRSIEAMGGTIDFDTNLDTGTAMRILLPIAP